MGYNSTIISKKKKCVSCGLPSYIFSKGRCKSCATIEDTNKRIAAHEEVEDSERSALKKESGMALSRWFLDRRKEMTGRCLHCGGKSCKTDDKYYKHSIAHILPKAYFKSVATHPSNWIELCFWGNSCHTNMDNSMLDLTEMSCWDTIITRFQEMYPSIDAKERKRIPETLLQYIEVDL
jgi:hypothetical protein